MLICPVCNKQEKMLEMLREELRAAKEKIEKLEKENKLISEVNKDVHVE